MIALAPLLAPGLWLARAEAGEISLWHSYRGEERAALEAAAAQYQAAHPGVVILPLFVANEGYSTKLESAIPNGNGPDLFVYAHERIADWSARAMILPVDPALAGPQVPAATAALTWEGAVWGQPLSAKSLALFYNRALVATPPATTDALIAAATPLTAPLEGRYGFAYEVASAYHNAGWMHAYGGGVFPPGSAADAPPQLDTPANAAAFGLIQHLALDVVPPEPTGALLTQLFNEGRLAMMLNGPWFLGEVSPSIDYGVAPLPVVSATGKPAAPYVSIEAVFQTRDNPEARAFAAWLAGPDGAALRQAQGKQVVTALEIPPAEGKIGEVLAAFRAQAEVAVPIPVRPVMGQTWEPLARSLRRLTRGVATPAQAAAEAQTQLAVLTRPPAPPAAPAPYLLAGGLAALAFAGWFGQDLLRADRRAAVLAQAKKMAFAYLYILPAFAAMTVLTVVPFVVGAAVSLFEQQEQTWTFIGLTHFLDILLARDFPFSSPLSFWFTLAVTLLWTLANVALHVSIGVALAMLLREPWVRLRGAFRAALILPWAIPSYITALVWKGMFHRQFGAINALLAALGLEPVSWFAQFSTAFSANLATNTWLGFPFMMVVTLGALQSIPRDLEEAAEVDGASGWQRFVHVTLPLLRPALLPAVLLGSVWTFNMFNIIYLVSGGEPDGSTDILISQAYRWAFTRGHRYGYASAYAVIIFGVLLLYGQIANRIAGKKVI